MQVSPKTLFSIAGLHQADKIVIDAIGVNAWFDTNYNITEQDANLIRAGFNDARSNVRPVGATCILLGVQTEQTWRDEFSEARNNAIAADILLDYLGF